MKLALLPLLGPWHLLYPRYNAVSVLELVRAFAPEALALTPLVPGALRDPRWQATPEVALPLSVVPWAQRRALPLYEVFEPSPDEAAESDFRRYLEAYETTRATLREVDAPLSALGELLRAPLTLTRVRLELLPLLESYQRGREAAFEDGPGTDWLRARTAVMAERVAALPHTRVAVLASAEHLPFLREALAARLGDPAVWEELPELPAEPSDAVRERALLDVAFRGEVEDPGALIAQLRTLEHPEARFHEANLLLANGHMVEALAALRAGVQGDFSAPYYLPGYLLARLGQVCDLVGERDEARRAYRGVLALSWAPDEAVAAARAGLEAPFEGLVEPAGSPAAEGWR
ncbi:hypothetical protein [Truepera radiovictrix]|uniref:Uncharacterized protein n=1 Tax=Truepera radiovictrix (strain DSM 17093 / CIP 108686 / LMG 22925 / RQ-24) TaxID=649638 RepID=D7CV18_TRURR|nr:hypothetical protein [Truepera radiovictrix]ADI15845.1 conserved hypothetical protein [Truepera radiovictrix DSM 17093]WMT58530.1 hypothetical protein RCV51_06185 [Truepera radiovictrix]